MPESWGSFQRGRKGELLQWRDARPRKKQDLLYIPLEKNKSLTVKAKHIADV